MKTNFISREDNKVKFSMEFSAEEFENAQIEAYKKNKDQFTIDGFRKGKAPRTIIERHYGEGVFFEDALDELFRENYGSPFPGLIPGASALVCVWNPRPLDKI
ncbi:MAG: trigger factor family protein, partial [Firmicutes bacterium]|nr:trigger factor family protein [Bacillota bacterium]